MILRFSLFSFISLTSSNIHHYFINALALDLSLDNLTKTVIFA